jgi:hypothetical protein
VIELHDDGCIRIDETFAIVGAVEGGATLTRIDRRKRPTITARRMSLVRTSIGWKLADWAYQWPMWCGGLWIRSGREGRPLLGRPPSHRLDQAGGAMITCTSVDDINLAVPPLNTASLKSHSVAAAVICGSVP